MSQEDQAGASVLTPSVNTLFENKVNAVFVGFDAGDGKGTKILGKTSGGVTSGYTFTKVALTSDQGGATPYDNVITGQDANVVTNLVDVSEDLLNQIMPGVKYDSENNVLVGFYALFESEREGNEGILRLYRAIDESSWSERDEDVVSFPIAFPSFEEANFLSFMTTEQRQLAITMMCKPAKVETLTGVTNDTLTVDGKSISSILFSMGTPGSIYPPIVHQKANITFPEEWITGDTISIELNGETISTAWDTDQDTTMAALITAIEASTGFPTAAEATNEGLVLTISGYLIDQPDSGNFGTRGIEEITISVTHASGDPTTPELELLFI